MISLLASMFRKKEVPLFPIFLDSPMAIEASRIYMRHKELYDEELLDFIREKPLAEDLRTLKICSTSEDSIAINNIPGPFMVLAGAGMCNAGRILHHLKYNLWKPETHVIIVGYQGSGTLGRMLVDGAKTVRIFGDKIAVNATVHTLGGFSAHAGQKDLLDWFSTLAPLHPKLIIIHGENGPRIALAEKIDNEFSIKAYLPGLNEELDI
jgi:metallo-beta-lactamase family protein